MIQSEFYVKISKQLSITRFNFSKILLALIQSILCNEQYGEDTYMPLN